MVLGANCPVLNNIKVSVKAPEKLEKKTIPPALPPPPYIGLPVRTHHATAASSPLAWGSLPPRHGPAGAPLYPAALRQLQGLVQQEPVLKLFRVPLTGRQQFPVPAS